MLLKKLFEGLNIPLDKSQGNIDIKGISTQISKILEGDMFFDLKGDKNINQIFEKGARFIVRLSKSDKLESKRVYSCKEPRRFFALVSKAFYKNACDKMKIVGITGTNGKTSTTKLVYDILRSCGKRVGAIGTFGCEFLGKSIETGFTTPDPDILHSLFFKMQREKVEYVVMEVSAHSIALNKLDGIKFECLALTNISQDHLDFFETMENYANTKLSFFTKKHTKSAVICVDDAYGLKLSREICLPSITFGMQNPSDVFAIDEKSDFSGSEFILNCLDDVFKVSTPLVGHYNILNCLCALAISKILGVKIENAVEALAFSGAEKGRFNSISFAGINVVIDYAHTPNGLENMLKVARGLSHQRLILLFGCGGNRDSKKRKIMGQIAEKYADYVFLSSDNPRFENPAKIIEEIESGMSKDNHTCIENRKEAICKALAFCQQGDTLIIAGKGAEKHQEIMGKKYEYSDFDQVFKFFRKNISVVDVDKEMKHGC